MFKKNSKTVAAIALSIALAVSVSLSGCVPSGDTSTTTQKTIEIKKGAANKLCNDSLTMTVIDAQRRPLSLFQGSAIDGSNSSGSVNVSSTNDVVIEVDLKIAFNVNTLMTALGAEASKTPETLADIMPLGTLMFIQGNDAEGGQYTSSDVITPTAQESVNQLAINSQWDYNILNSPLPEASAEASGSLLFKVSSTAKNLQLVIITPTGGADPSNQEAVQAGDKAVYVLPLS